MKTLLSCLFLSASAFGQLGSLPRQSEHLATMESPQKMGKPTWIMTIDRDYTAFAETPDTTMLHFEKKPAHKGALDRPDNTDWMKDIRDSFPVIQLRRYELNSAVAILGKFAEWSATAKKNSIKSYEKEIGKTERGDQSFVFSVAGYVPSLIIRKPSQSEESLDEFDAATVAALIAKLPELDVKTFKKKAQDTRDPLFK